MQTKPFTTKDELIHYLVQSKKEMKEEIRNSYHRPEIQKAIEELRRLKTNKL